ncbi:MAG: hypothetical protein U0793_27055 [Gemmataceae bacterium]
MTFDPAEILSILDRCCDAYAFPMLDNGYVYLAATRLSLYRSEMDWAMVIEVFGYSPRAGVPDTSIQTFASRLHDRDPPENYVNRQAYERYLANRPNNEYRSIFPVQAGPWQDEENDEFVAEGADEVLVRTRAIPLPSAGEYVRHGIHLEQAPRVQVFELCRFLAAIARDQVLATAKVRRVSILPGMEQILQLEEWHHPNVVAKEGPSSSETFQQLARVLATGDARLYRPTQPPNTHWRNWPDGGRL